MDWLYLSCATLDAPQFLGSEPTDRATWLCLLRFCVGQENSGRVVDCQAWTDRRWQQIAGVTKAETERTCDLWTWKGKDLIVWGYPQAQEDRTKANRRLGKKGAKARWKPPGTGGA